MHRIAPAGTVHCHALCRRAVGDVYPWLQDPKLGRFAGVWQCDMCRSWHVDQRLWHCVVGCNYDVCDRCVAEHHDSLQLEPDTD